jgi:phospholipid/cholesterol/gamma-HCH transport system substrate-binding protein
MAENSTEVLAGAVVLAVALGFFFWAGQDTGLGPSRGGYELRASFRSVEGITVGSDVRLAGVKIGTITRLSLNPTTFFADAVVAMNEGIALPQDSAILISSDGLLGGAYVEVLPGGSAENLGPGDEIEDTQGAVSLISLMMKFIDGGSSSTPPPAPGSP